MPSIVTLGLCFAFWSNPVNAKDYDGIYTGIGVVSPGTECLGNSYHLEMKVRDNRFEVLVTRQGGREANSQFRVSGNVDSSGKLRPNIVGGRGSNLFFLGQIENEKITGSSGASTHQTRCVWNYTLTKKESEQLKIWFNTFIPTRVAEIPMVGCAHADNRDFSSDPRASSRTHQMVELEVEISDNQVIDVTPVTINENNRVGESYFVDCTTGNQTGRSAYASSRDIRNSWQRQGNEVIVNFKGRIGIPLLPSCPIDFDVNVAVNLIDKTYRVVGGRDGFPAYETYLQVNNNSPQQIFAYNPRQLQIEPASSDGLCRFNKRNPISERGQLN